MSVLSRNVFLTRATRRFVDVPCPSLSTETDDKGAAVVPVVRLRMMSELQRSNYEVRFLGPDGNPSLDKLNEARRCMVISTAVDENDKPLFTDADLDLLGDVASDVMGTLYDAGRVLCGFDKGPKPGN